MIEIRSFRRVFDLERRVYSVDRFRLNPAGVPVRGILYLLVALLTAIRAATRCSGDDRTAVHHVLGAGDERRLIGQEETDQGRDVVSASDPTEGHAGQAARRFFGTRGDRVHSRFLDSAGVY